MVDPLVFLWLTLALSPLLQAAPPAVSSPVDFGRREFLAALQARGLKPEKFKLVTEHSLVLPPDGYSIQGQLIRGGNLRGILYGLLEAAGQIRRNGRLSNIKTGPAFAVRGVRWERPLPEQIRPLFESLARARINRFVAAYPGESLERLRSVSELAWAHGIDFGVSVPSGQSPARYLAALPRLKHIECRAERSNLEEIAGSGRLVTLDLDAAGLEDAGFHAAVESRIPLLVAAEPGASGGFFRKPEVTERVRAWQVIWRLKPSPAAGPAFVRNLMPALAAGGTSGFEVVAPGAPAPFFFEIWGQAGYDPTPREAMAVLGPKPAPALLAALEAGSLLPPDTPLKPLEEAMEEPPGDPWTASPAGAARSRIDGVSSAKSLPLDRSAQYDAAASVLESASRLEPALAEAARHARIAARRLSALTHLAWARAAGDSAALAMAGREAASALELDPANPVLQADEESIRRHRSLAARPANAPERFPGTVTPPRMSHTPPKSAMAMQALRLGLNLSTASNLRVVRLHWRPLSAAKQWNVLEAPPSNPTFLIPASSVTAAYDIEYFFEVLHDLGAGWFLPEQTSAVFPQRYVVTTTLNLSWEPRSGLPAPGQK